MTHYALILALACLLAGCAASRSPLTGTFTRQAEKNYGAEKTTVCFLFRHLSQVHGFDSIPKLQEHGVKDFDNIFRDALPEITNISSYVTFTESPADVNNPQAARRTRGNCAIRTTTRCKSIFSRNRPSSSSS